MARLYLIRHAYSESNLKQIYDGDREVPLCEEGRKQLKYLPDYFKDIPVSQIYSSPIGRAKETAQSIADVKRLPIIICPELRERYVGPYAGVAIKDIRENKKTAPLVEKFMGRANLDGMESAEDVQKRVVQAIEKIAAEHEDEDVVIVSHGFAIQMYMAYALRISLWDYEKNIIRNAAVTRVHYNKPHTPQVMAINEMYHLPETLRADLVAQVANVKAEPM